MATVLLSGYQGLSREWRVRRDGRDCCWNVIVTVAEARGLNGLGNHGLNDCMVKVTISTDADDDTSVSRVHDKTSMPFFNHVFKLTFSGQPEAFFSSYVQVEVLHNREMFGVKSPKLIGLLQIGMLDVFHMQDHKLPMQWFSIVDLNSEEPAIPTGFIRMNVIVNSLGESGGVQSDVPEAERGQTELMIIPRLHACCTSTGAYNLIFKIYQARDLRTMDPAWGADPFIRVSCGSGEMRTDTRNGTVNPVWNQQLQIPIYEPLFREMILLEVWHENGLTGNVLMSALPWTWKDLNSNQDYFRQERWYDMYELPDPGIGDKILKNNVIKWVMRRAPPALKKHTATLPGRYQEPSVYCGRILLSVAIEDRKGAKSKPPSLAQTDLKPKDCKFFQDVHQKVYFRLQVFFAQGLAVPPAGLESAVQVELQIGQRTSTSKAVFMSSDGLFEWYEAIELEMDFLYDDARWPWSQQDYEDGLVPSVFIDEGMPDAWIKVYRCNNVGYHMGKWVNEGSRKLIGFNRCSIREFLGIGIADPGGMDNVDGALTEEGCRLGAEGRDKRNLILNKKSSSQPAFFLKDADELPAEFDPRRFGRTKCSLEMPAWPAPRNRHEGTAFFPDYDDGRGNVNSMDPYIGVQCFDLERDGTCALEDTDYPGLIWVSGKCYIPSRANCESAIKGPPLLSPFTKYNAAPIPRPSQMDKCMQVFCLRCHVFQARDLPASSAVGVANAFVEVRLGHRKARTHVVHGSNSPTWDTTLYGGELNNIELPCLGWPGRPFSYEDVDERTVTTYDVNANPGEEFEPDIWMQNQAMLRFAPWIEVRVMDEGNVLLGRCFVDPSSCLSTQQDPEWRSLFKGNPAQDEGELLFALQLIHKADPLQTIPPAELCPIRTKDAEDCLSDRTRVGRSVLAGPDSLTQEVFMRECRIQIQVLGLRNMDPKLGLKKPSVAVFIQTTDQWDADKRFSYECTQAKSSIDPNIPPNNQNFMETLELKVFLPDEKDYAPALEFVVMDEASGLAQLRRHFGGDSSREIRAWGSLSLADFHPQGTEVAETAEEGEEDEEDIAAQKRLFQQQQRKNFQSLLNYLQVRQMVTTAQVKLLKNKFESKDEGLLEVMDIYLSAPSEAEFLLRSEGHLLDPKGLGITSAAVGPGGDSAETAGDAGPVQGDAGEGDDGEGEQGEAITVSTSPLAKSRSILPMMMSKRSSVRRMSAAGAGAGAAAASQTNAALQLAKANIAQARETPTLPPLESADAGPHQDGEQAADNPNAPVKGDIETADGEGRQGGDQGPGDADADDTNAAVGRADPVDAQDDVDADRQEEIDTPDGKPNAEWLIFRKNRLYTQPLEDTADWRERLQDAFHEVSLFHGKVPDYKRRDASRVGIVKCLVKVFRKENMDEQGKSANADGTREATFYEVLARDASVEKGIDVSRPYRMYNIYELYPECVLDVRLYCLKAVQVTPGGLGRRNPDGSPYWSHYLQATLGQQSLESDVDAKLNPSFFHTFVFKSVVLPGPSQLMVALRDGELKEGGVVNSELVGETTIDLEDRWFCPDWRDLLFKPREVRDLYNEATQPGISQGKLIVVLDMVDEVRAEDVPPMDIQVLGKTLPMEMRMVVWDTRDTAGKDGYTSDVYVRAELLGVGEPKETDVHYGVKMHAFGMFNYRLKWRCKYPTDGVEYLMRIGIWDYNMLTPHQCIAEGVIPLRTLFQECFEKNQGKTSPDDMEVISLPGVNDPDGAGAGGVTVDEDGAKYPFRWFTMFHPSVGFDPTRDAQAKLKITIQVQPRARARANPAGSKRNGPARLPEPDRPPQPANPILESEKCKAYIVYSIKECFARCRVPCLCCCCVLIVAAIVAAVVGVKMAIT